MFQKHGRSHGRFKFTLHDDTKQFNCRVIVDIFYLKDPTSASRKRPVLRIVDKTTQNQAAIWLKNVSATNNWNTLRRACIDAYLGPPEVLKTNSGKNFTAKEFKKLAASTGITVNIVPVDSHSSIGIVGRYHGPLRCAYQIIRNEMLSVDKNTLLETAGPDRLVPNLLVYGTFPRITDSEPPHATTMERGKAIRKAMTEVSRVFATV